jgi:hypothetical protein
LGTPEDVHRSVRQLLESLPDRRRTILSAGGFTHAQFSPDKVAAFCDAASFPWWHV